jgi:hypothetical protein
MGNRRIAGSLLALVFGAGCTAILGINNDYHRAAEGGGGGEGGAGGAGGCKHTPLPPYPTETADSGDIDFVAALRSVDLGESAGAQSAIGLDVDSTCTCLGDGPSCLYPPYATKDHCDGTNGIDNSAAGIFKSIAAALGADGFGSTFYSQMAEQGEWSLLVRVQGYNGQVDDPKVKLSIYMTPGYLGDGGAGGAGGVTPDPQPKWDGNDAWAISTDSLADGASLDMPIYFDANAYISGGQLVANLPNFFIPFQGTDSSLNVSLTAGVLIAAILNPESDNLGWRIVNGTIAGRWKTADLFKNLGSFSSSGQSFCNDGGITYTTFKKSICGFVDIASTLGGATLDCDAISFGMLFQTMPAKLGPLYVPVPSPSTCPEGQDPALDDCDK